MTVSRQKRELIIATWERLGSKPIGEKMLRAIQRALREAFGKGVDESPAAMARVLADEGAELRHPEVIEFDASWRQTFLRKQKPIEPSPTSEKPLTFLQAIKLIKELEKKRTSAIRADDQINLRHVRERAITEKQRAELLARSSAVDGKTRAEQTEIGEWIRVWLQTPALFHDWLELRRQTAAFRAKFPKAKS